MSTVKDVATWGALIGALLPILIAVVQQPTWSQNVRRWMSVGISVVAGIGTVIASGNFDLQNWLVTIVAVVGAAHASFAVIFKPSGVSDKIEQATTPAKNQNGTIDVRAAIGFILVVVLVIVLVRWLA